MRDPNRFGSASATLRRLRGAPDRRYLRPKQWRGQTQSELQTRDAIATVLRREQFVALIA